MRDRVRGRVASFDHDRGWGEVESDEGDRYFFHCTAIDDGTRTIDQGRAVVFDVRAGRQGRWEAVGVSPQPRT